ncbi:twin-arginine translocase TatA/TatE family subunit [Sphaerisporangium album]|uniref:Sec-independent protein translocase protein TatA n=1 Tax=Sphaerisporangium album TaxID=509200 RepID=A0A367FHL8_9ACTN|nr:Sec-independent protein translocase subunit TatA [Sphaerisporangium album]RCG29784.1 twin-arginine translocase TatA/TatE family subunit [Sphaerisporangium album]
MGGLGAPELIIIGLVLVLLFGAKKLPDTARALGQSLRLFKKETTKLHEEDDARAAQANAQPIVVQPQPIQPAAPSVEDRLRLLEEENAKLRTTSQARAGEATVGGSSAAQTPKDQGSV